MDLRKIKKLIDLLEESNLAEIEIKEGEESVRLARAPKGSPAAMASNRSDDGRGDEWGSCIGVSPLGWAPPFGRPRRAHVARLHHEWQIAGGR